MTPFEEFWQAYPGTKQNKPACEAKYKKFSPELHTKIMLAIDAQKRWRREALNTPGTFVKDWRMASTWLNQAGWDDENPYGSIAELKEKQKAIKCHCGNPLPCETHFYPENCQSVSSEARRQRFNELGIKKGPNGWKEPCLKYIYSINPRIANLLNRGSQ